MLLSDQISAAKTQAASAKPVYDQANRKFGRIIEPLLSDVPKSLVLGHVLRVNPDLADSLIPNSTYRRGFLKASREECQKINVDWSKLNDPMICSYVFLREFNAKAYSLYTANTSLFLTPSQDFWKCTYLRLSVGDPVFNQLWPGTVPSTVGHAYDEVMDWLDKQKKSIGGYPILKLKKLVFYDCNYVFEICRLYGTWKSSGFGREPVLNANKYRQVFA